jgi:RNA polymerase sigma-70 factor (ECF subfamily)
MERYATGDDAAFAVVYDALAPRLFAYLRRKVRTPARAEDLLQQTFLHVHRSRGTFVRGSAVLPWSLSIARRLWIDDARREQRSALGYVSPEEDAALLAVDNELLEVLDARLLGERLQAELVGLPPLQREAFELVRLDGLSNAQAAEALGVSINSVKLRAHRAYVSLRRALGLR